MKQTLVIPLAGHGRRFKSMGYDLPKQMLAIDDLTAFEHSIKSIDMKSYKTYFVLRKDQIVLSEFINRICANFDFEIVYIAKDTRGSVETVLEVRRFINEELPLTIFTMDVTFNPVYSPSTFSPDIDGALLTFKSNSRNYSYAKQLEDGRVLETAEKVPISNQALVGVYFFKKATNFFKFAVQMIEDENISAGEFYIAPLYNYLISANLLIKAVPVDEFYVFGTPREYEFYKDHIVRSVNKKVVGLCADHSGFELKEKTKEVLKDMKIEFIDYGTFSHKDCDYNEVVNLAAEGLTAKEVDFVIGSCRSGQGVAIASGAHKGVIPALIYDMNSGQLAIRHNCANFISLPSALWQDSLILNELITLLVTTYFEGGRHQERLMKVLDVKNDA